MILVFVVWCSVRGPRLRTTPTSLAPEKLSETQTSLVFSFQKENSPEARAVGRMEAPRRLALCWVTVRSRTCTFSCDLIVKGSA